MCKVLLFESHFGSCKPQCAFSRHSWKWVWSNSALHSRGDPGWLKWEEKMPLQERSSTCRCSAGFLPEQDLGVNLREGWLHRLTKQKLGHWYFLATPRDHLTIKTGQLQQPLPWKINLSATGEMGLVVDGCTATQHWSTALPALQSCYQPRGEKLERKVPRGSAWDEEPPWKGSPTHRETPSTFWGARAAAACGDNFDGPSKVCFKTPSSSFWQSSETPE